MNDIGAYCEDGAGVELVQLIIGGKNVYMGAETTLAGKESDFTAAIGYQVTGENRLDMNYNAVHEGKKTTSSMTANGVLRDHAKKLFRGTIDFKKGAKGAKGDELEDVATIHEKRRAVKCFFLTARKFFYICFCSRDYISKALRCNGFVDGPNSAGSCYILSHCTLF